MTEDVDAEARAQVFAETHPAWNFVR